jgi:hypothetical protein
MPSLYPFGLLAALVTNSITRGVSMVADYVRIHDLVESSFRNHDPQTLLAAS